MKEMFPTLAIESSEQKKLQKIVESIGGFAGQMGNDNKRGRRDDGERLSITNTPGGTQYSQERFGGGLRRDPIKDNMN